MNLLLLRVVLVASFCVAVDSSGNALSYDGTSWAGPTIIVPYPYGDLISVSCSSSSFCAATNNHGLVTIYNGSSRSWRIPSTPSATTPAA